MRAGINILKCIAQQILKPYLCGIFSAMVLSYICFIFNVNSIRIKISMKKIVDYRKLLGVNEAAELQELKTIYRSMMKTWHPDKFQHSAEEKEAAEEKSKTIIEAYHFLVSIAPETRNQTIADYTLTTTSSNIADFEYKSQVLKVSFLDGSEYEYFDVPKAVYVKLINADSPGRFARRHIFNNYVYRSVSRLVASA
jgi:hypothetical protein